jgi:hypothetical protein
MALSDRAADRVLPSANDNAETMAFSSRGVVGGAAENRASAAPAPSAVPAAKRLRLSGASALESVRSTMCNSADVNVYRAVGMNKVILVSGDSLAVASEQCVAAGTPAKPAAPNQLNAVVTTSTVQPQSAKSQTTDTMTAAAVEAPARAPVPANPPLRVLRWVNTETNRVYVLRGYVSQEELEAIRKKIEQ